MLKIENLSAGYARHAVLSGMDAVLPSSSLVAVVGRNGSGKSTLLRTLAGLLPPLGGCVLYDGTDITSVTVTERARMISFVSTERVRVGGLSCHDMVALGRAPYTDWRGRLSPADEEAVRKALSLVGMERYADRKMDRMSDGECQMAVIARAVAQDTPAIILDEPTAFLDYPNRCRTASVLKSLSSEEGKTIIWSTHDIDLAMGYSDCFMIVRDGGISLDSRDLAGALCAEKQENGPSGPPSPLLSRHIRLH